MRGFSGAAPAAYFDRDIEPTSVERTLSAVRASNAYAQYLAVAARAPKQRFTPPRYAIADALALVLAAEQPMGAAYAGAYAQLLDPANQRLDICTAPECDDDGFSVGFSGLDSGVYYGAFDGNVRTVRAIAHESGHAVHREFMSRYQPIAAYNRGPAFMFESFAIFNELLFINHLYERATSDAERAYYLNYFLDDATFQVFGSAQETELESAIYHGVDNATIKTAADFEALNAAVFARYDAAAATDPATRLYWARNRLFFTDPLYDVNYLYAGLLALEYFMRFERDPAGFAPRYVALLKWVRRIARGARAPLSRHQSRRRAGARRRCFGADRRAHGAPRQTLSEHRSVVAGRDDSEGLDHQHGRALRRARPVHHVLGHA